MKRFLSIFSIALTCVIFLILSATSVQAAGERYWVNGTGDWSDATNHWAIISGGTPDASYLPTPEDNVFIDSNSGFGGGGSIDFTWPGNNPKCHDFTSTTGSTYTVLGGGNALYIYGSAIFEAGLTVAGNAFFGFLSTSAGETITSNGFSFWGVAFAGIGGEYKLLDDFTQTDPLVLGSYLTVQNGTFDANGFNVTTTKFKAFAQTGYTPTINMGSGIWTITGNDNTYTTIWDITEADGEVVTINAETSTIKLTSAGGNKIFAGGGKTYNNLWFIGADGFYSLVRGSNTFNDLKVTNPPTALTFIEFETTTVTTFSVSGTAGNLITLNSDNNSDQFILSKDSGVVSGDYLDISNSNANGGATWYAGNNSVNTTNNDGWIFEDAPTPTPTPTQTSNPSVAGAVSDGLGCGSHDCSNITTTRRSVSTVNPVSNPSTTPTATGFQLFDIALTIENAVLGASSELIARTQFTSFGTVPTLVNMVYRIEDASGKEVFSENDEVTVETEQLVTKEFKNLEMKDGKYTLILSTTYGDNVTDEFKQAFEVLGAATTKKATSNTWTLILVVVSVISGVIAYLCIKRRKIKKLL